MIFFCKTEADFFLWCKKYVPRALEDRRAFRKKELDVHEQRDRYDEVLTICRNLTTIRCLLDKRHLDFLNHNLLGDEPYERTPVTAELYRDIYAEWCRVCFSNGQLHEQYIDNVAMGHRLKALRLKKELGINRVTALTGIDKKTLYAYEEGKCQVRLNTLLLFSQLYGFRIDELLAEKGIVKKQNDESI